MRKLIYLLIFILCCQTSLSQESATDTKYLKALIYLKTNTSINEKLQVFQKKWIKKNNSRKKCFVEFNLAQDVDFMPIFDFRNKIDYSKCDLDKELIEDMYLYKEKYFFESFKIPLFRELVSENSSRLYLTFSKPVGNYLIAEFKVRDKNYKYDMPVLKNGPALHLLIFFNDGAISDVYTAGSYYN